MDYVDLTEEQKAKISACKGPEDVLALAKEEGVELTEEHLSRWRAVGKPSSRVRSAAAIASTSRRVTSTAP